MKKWFTLIEMLIVIVIIGILAWALIPRIGTARDKAYDVAREANVRSLAVAMAQYWLDHNWYPESVYKNGEWLLTLYGIPKTFDWQPTDNDYYGYVQLDGGSHFAFYVTLSEWSSVWNCTISTKCIKNGEPVNTSLKDCEKEGGTIHSKISAFTNWVEDEISAEDKNRYSAWNTKVVSTNWNAFCYVQ